MYPLKGGSMSDFQKISKALFTDHFHQEEFSNLMKEHSLKITTYVKNFKDYGTLNDIAFYLNKLRDKNDSVKKALEYFEAAEDSLNLGSKREAFTLISLGLKIFPYYRPAIEQKKYMQRAFA